MKFLPQYYVYFKILLKKVSKLKKKKGAEFIMIG